MGIEELEKFLDKHKDKAQIVSIGKSVQGRNIYAVNFIFNPKFKWTLVTAGIHAREHLSCDLVCRFIEMAENRTLNFNISFVPLVNPDGVELCLKGSKDNKLIQINGSEDFSLYKANANGVDLNNNFDANWDKKFTYKTSPSSQGYYGIKAESEPETQGLVAWARKLDLFLTVSYHLKGEEIYYDFHQKGSGRERDKTIAEIFSKSNGYKIKSTQNSSSGGFKDWCVKSLKIPSLTIELGDDKISHPYPKSEIDNIFNKNIKFFECVEKAKIIYENYENK